MTKKKMCVENKDGVKSLSNWLLFLYCIFGFSQTLSSIVRSSTTISQMFLFPYSVKTFNQSRKNLLN